MDGARSPAERAPAEERGAGFFAWHEDDWRVVTGAGDTFDEIKVCMRAVERFHKDGKGFVLLTPPEVFIRTMRGKANTVSARAQSMAEASRIGVAADVTSFSPGSKLITSSTSLKIEQGGDGGV